VVFPDNGTDTMKHLTEADMARLPGLVVRDNGYMIDSPKGRVYFENCHPMDEMFASSIVGWLNISKAWRNVKLAGAFVHDVPIEQGLIQNVAKAEYDHRVVRSMTPERRDEPILMLVCYDGLNVIDGIHRLKRRVRDKLPTVKAHILLPDTLADMRVRMFREEEFEWRQDGGLTDDELNLQIQEARKVGALLTGGTMPLPNFPA
jgi:hypothetical protein